MTKLDEKVLGDALAYADRWIAFRREVRDIPGLVVAVQYGDQPVFSRAYGLAQLEPAVPMTTRHIFRIASHSKTFTATAVMQLVEQGRLRLDDRASAYIPWLASDVTLRQLLNHASGIIRDGIAADFWRVEMPFPDLATLREFADEFTILQDPANQLFKYSNIGFALLGIVIEAVSGTSYNAYVQEHIVERLGLADTGPEFDPDLAARLVTGYTQGVLGVPRRPVPNIDTRALSPATGFYSTALDLCRYASAHRHGNDALLSDTSKREMQHASWKVEGSEDWYGLGFTVQLIGKRHLVGHGGGFPGQSTRTLLDPVDGLIVVVLSNTSAPDGLAAPLAAELVRIIDFAQDKARQAVDSTQTTTWPLDRYTGRFANIGGVTDIAAFGNALIELDPESDSPTRFVTDLEVVDADTLRIARAGGYASPSELVRYERDAEGATLRVVAGGVSSYPEDVFRKRYADQPRWPQ
jgi:CubicO group peptidase (beta-lactamase class C family)